MNEFLSTLFRDFIDQCGGAMIALAVYGVSFYLFSKMIGRQPAAPDRPENFTVVHDHKNFFHKDFRLEFGYFFFNTVVTDLFGKLLTVFLSLYILTPLLPYQLFDGTIQALPFPIQLLLGLLVADAAFFFPHWFSHKFLWRYHSIHHSAEELTWITALRLHPIDHLAFVIGGTLAMHLLGFGGQAIIYAIMIHSAWNVFVHANLSLNFPRPLCYILAGPNYHRWHHAAEKEAIDKNLATMFPVFDLIFGTYYYPQNRLPRAYGLYGEKERRRFPKTLREQLLYPLKKK